MLNKTILAFDSTATVATAAVRKNGSTLGEFSVNAGNTHSTTLLPMAEQLMKSCSLTFDDIDIYALAQGPGSFTGVRIGAAVVKGLAFKNETPCVGVSTLEALAYSLRGIKGTLCPCMNARREQVYTAIFKSDGKTVHRVTEDMAISVEELRERLSSYDDVYFCGDGYFLVEGLTENITPEGLRCQSAASVAAVAERIYEESEDKSFPPDSLAPTYLRLPQAERERLERLNKEKNND